MRGSRRPALALCLAAAFAAAWAHSAHALDRRQVAVVVNTWDPLSKAIGEYYAERRGILFQNIIRIGFKPGRSALTAKEFAGLRQWVEEQTRPNVQAYALTWAAPWRVECMSITSAFAFGYDPAYCAAGCGPTRSSRYFDSRSRLPYAQLRLRPTMAIAATSFAAAKALIDRGVRADGTFPRGTAYFVSTTDRARNVRSVAYPLAEKVLAGRVRAKTLKTDALRGAKDVLFYFIGRQNVDGLDSLRFVPGAVADHLTSFGGALTSTGGQMSALRWLEAGATGSYGTVVEPCNARQKFPDPAVLAFHYLGGETLIEAYWKSVAMPGQGIFIGEPLAAPFRARNAGR
jgi:uncharacterized protein (TIGR03790 family)